MNFGVFKKPIILALTLFVTSLLIRLVWLDKVPVGIVNDNMIFVLNAKAVFHTGRDVTGLWHPLAFAPIPDEPAQAELPYTLLAPVIGPLPSSLFSAHILHAVINSVLVVVLFLIVFKLLGKWPAFIVGLVASFNPWNIFFGRSAFEASLALFFYVFGFYVLLKTTSWKKLWAIIPFACGFYTYMAYKITFLPYVFIISFFIWSHINHKKYTKHHVVLLLVSLILFFTFLFNIKSQSTANRLDEISLFSVAAIEKQVNIERKFALQNHFTDIFINKAAVFARNSIAKYYGAFSPDYLFVENEGTLRFNIFNHGYFYYADFIFFLVGFFYLFVTKRKVWAFCTAIILIAPIPSVLSNIDTSYAMRSSLYFPFFYIFIGVGIWYTLAFLKSKKYFIFAASTIGAIYLVLIANFLYIYFYVQPIYRAEGVAFSARVLSRYVNFANHENKALTVVINSPKVVFKDFIYYSDSYNKGTSEHFRNAF